MKAQGKTTWFDANAWIGGWPFAMRPEETVPALKRRMRAAGVARALVSPLAAILAPDPMPANEALLLHTTNHPALFPAPVVNLRLRIWPEHLEACCADRRVRAIRIAPAWHGYSLRAAATKELAHELAQRKLALIVTARLEDERQQHHALKIRGLSIRSLDQFLATADPTPVLCTGLYRPEIMQLAAHQNLLAELSMAEWDQTVKNLLDHLRPDQLCLGSLAPFLSMHANVAKIQSADIPRPVRRRIAAGNLRKFLRL